MSRLRIALIATLALCGAAGCSANGPTGPHRLTVRDETFYARLAPRSQRHYGLGPTKRTTLTFTNDVTHDPYWLDTLVSPFTVTKLDEATYEGEVRAAKESQSQLPARMEVMSDPLAMANLKLSVTDLTFNGIRIGDPRSKIPASRLREEHPDMVNCNDGFAYDVEKGRVWRVFVYNEPLLARLGIKTTDDIERIFGKPDKKEYKSRGAYYCYHLKGNHIKLNFFPDMQRVGDIFISERAGDFDEH